MHGSMSFNPLPNDKILDSSKLKAFADNKFNVALMIISVSYWEENIVEKGENASFPQCPQKASFSGSLKVGIVC